MAIEKAARGTERAEREHAVAAGSVNVASVLPPLENGDRLTRAEFERRYEAMPQLKKAELIEGVVYTQPKVRYREHGVPSSSLAGWVGAYGAHTPGAGGAVNATVRLDLDNEPQPDIQLRLEQGGQSCIDEDDFVEGAPELVVEVAASSASYDLHDKLQAYRRNGVQEYVVWRVLDGELDWLALREGRYERLEPDGSGVLRSEVFPGLWLDVPALLRGELAAVLSTLQAGLASAEHAALVERLRAAATQQPPPPATGGPSEA
jgi:Uma2 family endonuclease